MENSDNKKSRLDGETSDVSAYVLSSEESNALEECRKSSCTFNYRGRNFRDKGDRKPFYDSDIDAKRGILKVAPSLVSLVSFSGNAIISQACGTIIETEGNVNVVLTSLNLVKQPIKNMPLKNILARNVKIIVGSSDQKSYLGDIVAYDFHYNLLIVKFKSLSPFQAARLRLLAPNRIQLRPHSSNMKSGNGIVVAGRYFCPPYRFMVADAFISDNRTLLEKYSSPCNELLLVKCLMSPCGDGAPLTNAAGEVIGMVYSKLFCEYPILPIDVIDKWWNHFKTFKEYRRPSYGLRGESLYKATWATLENVGRAFPQVSDGVCIQTVLPASNAEAAGLCKDDVITKCDGKIVKSFMELWTLMWHKVGSSVELEVARVGLSSIITVVVPVGNEECIV